MRTKRQDMLLPNMTYREVFDELNKDYKGIQQGLMKNGHLFSLLLRKTTRRFPICQIYSYTTPERKNKVYFGFYANKRSEWQNPSFNQFIIWDTPNGKCAVMANSLDVDIKQGRYGLIVVYTPHLFSRYRERFLKDEDLSNEEVVNRFFEKNARAYGTDISEELMPGSVELEDKSKTKIAYASEDGVAFGVVVEKEVIVMKTFVAYDMLYPNQQKVLLPLRDAMMNRLPHPEGRR